MKQRSSRGREPNEAGEVFPRMPSESTATAFSVNKNFLTTATIMFSMSLMSFQWITDLLVACRCLDSCPANGSCLVNINGSRC